MQERIRGRGQPAAGGTRRNGSEERRGWQRAAPVAWLGVTHMCKPGRFHKHRKFSYGTCETFARVVSVGHTIVTVKRQLATLNSSPSTSANCPQLPTPHSLASIATVHVQRCRSTCLPLPRPAPSRARRDPARHAPPTPPRPPSPRSCTGSNSQTCAPPARRSARHAKTSLRRGS